jgi:2'-5' RNA ligase
MDEHTQGVMVALRPITSDWSTLSLPHLTLVYAGKKGELRPTDFNSLAKSTASIAMEHSTIQLYTDGLDVFGVEGEEVEVIKVRATPQLMRMRQSVVSWNQSDWPYNPHVTIGPRGSFKLGMEIPPAIAFDRVLLQWGEEELNFWLKP